MKLLYPLGSIRSTFIFILFQAPILQLAPLANAQDVVDSHAFSGDELTALPQENWLTNGGNTYNQHLPLYQDRNYWM